MRVGLFAGAAELRFDGAAAVARLVREEPALGPLIEDVGPLTLRLGPQREPFDALAEAIVYQQLSGKAAATIYGRFLALFPAGLSPSALTALDDAVLRSAGLSAPKQRALRDLALRALAGELPTLEQAHALTDEELVERLTVVRGVGRWTVEMFLIFRLGRPDVWPVADLGVRKGWAAAFGHTELPTTEALARLGERFRPYRTVLAWYLWRAAERTSRLSPDRPKRPRIP